VFLQSPAAQAWIAGGFAAVGFMLVPTELRWRERPVRVKVFPMWGALAIFTALVWLDSAAFFIIQHSGDLKSATWGDGMLWRNAAAHLGVACFAGIWLAKEGARALPVTAWVILALAALAVNTDSTRGIAGWLYPVGVSLYSTALVAWPGWFSGAGGTRAAGWHAAWLFAVAGWFGSANGIGMAETLERVPPAFVIGSGAVVGLAWISTNLRRLRESLAVGLVAIIAWFGWPKPEPHIQTAFEQGRNVYLSEGCVHCHSQYVRPGSADEEIWGPARQLEEVMKNEPVLIGNRRQGPDLTHVGARRSEAWLRAHFIDPRALVPGSQMPNYAHLFADGRGDALIRYLRESGIGATADRIRRAEEWRPNEGADAGNARTLFAAHCANCHGADGHGNGPLANLFVRPPTNLVDGPFVWSETGDELELRMARVIKFGIVGTDMPGHEALTDSQVSSLVEEVLGLRVQTKSTPTK
jgi:cytochrome c oxidase cbb3-type subunit 2